MRPSSRTSDSATRRAALQEAEYRFPYHHVPRLTEAGFSQSVSVRWGYFYVSYLRFIMGLLGEIDFDSILDMGCGDGRLVGEVVERFPGARAVGVDTSSRAIQWARTMVPEGEFHSADLRDADLLPETFDVITMIEVLEHLPPDSVAEFGACARRRLDTTGRLIVTVPSKNVPLHPKHYQHFDNDSLAAALSEDFSLETSYFLHRSSRLARTLDRVLTNRFVTVTNQRMLALWLRLYERHWLRASAESSMMICSIFAPRESNGAHR